ncbi:MAG: hypothetical protein JWO35_795 [Candidatus Saccharibacteria bacterium]|nr:hypothetical protein [Candidatus Saccharibacteria bacterium]
MERELQLNCRPRNKSSFDFNNQYDLLAGAER